MTWMESLQREQPVFRVRPDLSAAQRAKLTLRQRNVLIFCNGQFTAEQMVPLLGGHAPGSTVTLATVSGSLFRLYWDQLIEWIPTREVILLSVPLRGGDFDGEPVTRHQPDSDSESESNEGHAGFAWHSGRVTRRLPDAPARDLAAL